MNDELTGEESDCPFIVQQGLEGNVILEVSLSLLVVPERIVKGRGASHNVLDIEIYEKEASKSAQSFISKVLLLQLPTWKRQMCSSNGNRSKSIRQEILIVALKL